MEEEIIELLRNAKRVAVVGLSDDPSRISFSVASTLLEEGYDIIPVNPSASKILGRKSYPTLLEVPQPVDIVNIFRRSEAVDAIVDDAIAIEAKMVWMQLGIVNERAAEKARASGLLVVMDRCIRIELGNLKMEGRL